MFITFLPMRSEEDLHLVRRGETLVVNGEDFDFAALPDGASLPAAAVASPWFSGTIRRESGVLHIMLILPHGNDAPEARRFPQPVNVTADGPVPLPSNTPAEPQP